MRFKTIAFALIVSSAVFILGCDDDDDSTIGEELYFQVTSTPPLDSGLVLIDVLSNFILANADTNEAVELWNTGGSANGFDIYGRVTGFTTGKIYVAKGEEVTIGLRSMSTHSTKYCSSFQVKAFLNGRLFDERTTDSIGEGWFGRYTCPGGSNTVYSLNIPW